MDCSFRQESNETRNIKFKDIKGRTIVVELDWSNYNKGEQTLNIGVYDIDDYEEIELGNISEYIFETEIELDKNNKFESSNGSD